jgi:hypothetical protein
MLSKIVLILALIIASIAIVAGIESLKSDLVSQIVLTLFEVADVIAAVILIGYVLRRQT